MVWSRRGRGLCKSPLSILRCSCVLVSIHFLFPSPLGHCFSLLISFFCSLLAVDVTDIDCLTHGLLVRLDRNGLGEWFNFFASYSFPTKSTNGIGRIPNKIYSKKQEIAKVENKIILSSPSEMKEQHYFQGSSSTIAFFTFN